MARIATTAWRHLLREAASSRLQAGAVDLTRCRACAHRVDRQRLHRETGFRAHARYQVRAPEPAARR